MKILANDGIAPGGKQQLEEAGFEVITTKVAQEQLINYINENEITGILVRSATKVRKDLIDACPSLKVIGRAGVGMDNIDVEYARSKGLQVFNTPAASSASVAELVFAHLYGAVRFLHDANRNMPLEGDSRFKDLKKSYAGGRELRGKTLGIIGFGRIGQEVAKIGLGVGMNVIACTSSSQEKEVNVTLEFFNGEKVELPVRKMALEKLIEEADFITLHIPSQKEPVLGKKEFERMKNGVGIINAARGGVIDEVALMNALEDEKVSFAALDTFENEPSPSIKVLMNENVSLSPHIGAATNEAQERIGKELADQLIGIFK